MTLNKRVKALEKKTARPNNLYTTFICTTDDDRANRLQDLAKLGFRLIKDDGMFRTFTKTG